MFRVFSSIVEHAICESLEVWLFTSLELELLGQCKPEAGYGVSPLFWFGDS